MLLWKTDPYVDEDIIPVVNHFHSLMMTYDIPYIEFRLDGEYYWVFEIKQCSDDYHVSLLDKGYYLRHFLSGSQLKRWKAERKFCQHHGFISNQTLCTVEDEVLPLPVQIINESFISFWDEQRTNHLPYIRYTFNNLDITISYSDENGFCILSN